MCLCIAVCWPFLPVQSLLLRWKGEQGLGLGPQPAYPMGRGPGFRELSCPWAAAELD